MAYEITTLAWKHRNLSVNLGLIILYNFLVFRTQSFMVSLEICVCVLSHFTHVWLFATLWTVVCQASLSMRFSRQEYWSGLSCPPPGDLPDPGIELVTLMSPALAVGFFTTSATEETSLELRKWKSLGCDSLWTHGLYSPWEFSRPDYWSGWPFPSPGDLPNPGIEPRSHTLQADSLPVKPQGKPLWKCIRR